MISSGSCASIFLTSAGGALAVQHAEVFRSLLPCSVCGLVSSRKEREQQQNSSASPGRHQSRGSSQSLQHVRGLHAAAMVVPNLEASKSKAICCICTTCACYGMMVSCWTAAEICHLQHSALDLPRSPLRNTWTLRIVLRSHLQAAVPQKSAFGEDRSQLLNGCCCLLRKLPSVFT